MPNVFCNQDWPGVVSQNFPTTLGRLKICFWLVWPSVNKEESQLKTYADVVGFSSVFCYAIVIPLCLLYLYGKQHIVLRASRTTVVAWQYIQQKFCTRKFLVLVIFRFEHKTQKNTRFDSSFNLSLTYVFKRLWTDASLLFLFNFWYPEVTAFQKGHLTLCLYEVLGSDTMKISRKEEDSTLRLVAAAAAYISVLYRGQVSWTLFQQDSSRPSSSPA